ncbi:hypothetical protein LCGC14_1480230, partial [marine sediment metagenome]
NQYEAASGVTISSDGNYGKLSAIKDSSSIATLIANASITDYDNIHIMNMIPSRIKTGASTNVEGAIVFAYNGDTTTFLVYAFTIPSTLTLLYTQTVTLSESKRFVDAVIYRENGIDYVYFADYQEAIKKIACDTTQTLPVSREQTLLLKTGFRGRIDDIDIESGNGGDLLCGTYQFTFRLINFTSDRYTKWSVLTNPITIGMQHSVANTQPYGGVGFVSDHNIELNYSFEKNYAASGTVLYDYVQFAVIENVNGTKEANLTVKVLSPTALSDVAAGTNITYDYSTNGTFAEELLTIDDVTVDEAAIKSVRTLQIKHNRLIGGNVIYHQLDYDNGSPTVAAGSTPAISVLTGVMGYSDYENATNKVGYWRGELYRFAISYFDEFGNYSKPKILDLSGVTDNKASSGTDMKFPDRSNGLYGTLLNASDNIQAMYLSLAGIDNHPMWAKGFVILRAPRKKKIQFQTPLVPSILVQPAQAKGQYPDQRKDEVGLFMDVLNVEAANPDGSYVPKNYFHILPKSMVNQGDLKAVTSITGRVYLINTSSHYLQLKTDLNGNFGLAPTSSETLLYSHAAGTASNTPEIWKDSGTKVTASDPSINVTWHDRVLANDLWINENLFQPYLTDSSVMTFANPTTRDYLITISDA